jgi:ferric enterobactin receptor
MPYRTTCLCALLLLSSFWLSAQSALVTEAFERTPLRDVFERFEQKYGLRLAYDDEIVRGKNVSLQLREETAVSALFQVLEAAALDYLTVGENKILIRPRSAAPPASTGRFRLSGQIRDAETGAPLPFASVQWAGHAIGSCADENGRFELRLPDTLNAVYLRARHIGYHSQSFQVEAAVAADLTLALQPSAVEVPEVLVLERFPRLSTDDKLQSTRIRPSAQLPGLGGQTDPLRQLQWLPGVAAHNDFNAGLQVRGGRPEENLMVWDGLILYELDHFFGIFSAVDGALVEDIQLYRNSFPAEYGGRTSSIVEIHAPAAAPEQAEGQVSLSNLTGSAQVDVPIGESMSLLAGGRFTHSNLGDSPLFGAFQQQLEEPDFAMDLPLRDRLVRIRPDFRFYDGFLKYRWQLGDATRLEVNAFRSFDAYDYQYSYPFRQLIDGRVVINENAAAERAEWQNEAAGFRLYHSWNEAWDSRLELCYSGYEESEYTQTRLSRRRPNEDAGVFETDNLRDNELRGLHAKWVNDWSPDSSQTYQLGYRFSQEATGLQLLNDEEVLLDRQLRARQHALFAAGTYTTDVLHWSWALHATYYDGSKSVHLSPRLRATLPLGPRSSLRFSLSRYHQFLRRYYYENRFGRSVAVWTMADERLIPVAHANQATLGSSFARGAFKLGLDLFYKHTEGHLQQAPLLGGLGSSGDPRPQSQEFRIFRGDGYAYGMELLLQQEGQHFSNWLSYTLSRSLQRYPLAFQNELFPAQDDRPHQLQWNGLYQRGAWSFSGTYAFASGAPFFDFSRASFVRDRREADPGLYQRINDYHRLDLSLAYQLELERMELKLGISVYNVFDRSNTLYRQQLFGLDPTPEIGIRRTAVLGNELQLLGRTLSVSAKLAW